MTCQTCRHGDPRLAPAGIRVYCKRYKRNMGTLDRCIDWRKQVSLPTMGLALGGPMGKDRSKKGTSGT